MGANPLIEHRGRLRAVGRIGIVVSEYHERITARLLEGAVESCREAGIGPDQIDIAWVAGAFELGAVCAALAQSGRYAALVALGVVVRGETPHFEYVAGQAARALAEVAILTRRPIGFGLLTVDTVGQAEARAGGSAGNKGREAADAAIRAADLLQQLNPG
jgi:6,7-dimethyl-8-ribityllumazine synthase